MGLSLRFCSLIAYEWYVSRCGGMESVGCEPPGDIQVMIPYWIYRRICNLLVAVQSAAKPEDYIVAVLEGHVRRLNL